MLAFEPTPDRLELCSAGLRRIRGKVRAVKGSGGRTDDEICLFGKGYERVLLVGTDVPTLPLSVYQDALTLLGKSDVVLGPALDGGYYLIGLKKPAENIFAGVPWSTDQVLAVTQQNAKTLGLSISLTTAWRDVDTIVDLHSLITECQEDNKKPKQDRSFSIRTAGAIQLLATRLKTR